MSIQILLLIAVTKYTASHTAISYLKLCIRLRCTAYTYIPFRRDFSSLTIYKYNKNVLRFRNILRLANMMEGAVYDVGGRGPSHSSFEPSMFSTSRAIKKINVD